ncbi:MAG: alpha/beta hydrolase [Bdellovibrionales bacterium]|nr:alpha/beta hydrolase [Bdellovibrionales bacterium]
MGFVLSTLIFLIFAAVLLVVSQDVQVFPAALMSLHRRPVRDPKTLPTEIESTFITTLDGKKLEVWRLAADDAEAKPYVGIVFHGNGGSLEAFLLTQLWFQELGITSYGFDYRGFGRSTGWPNEAGVYRDCDAVYKYVTERESVSPAELVVLGISVGGPFAARIAGLHKPKLLILVSTFSSIQHLVRQLPLIRHFRRLCWYKLPTIEYVGELDDTNLLLLHGERDRTISSTHSIALQQAYRGTGKVKLLLSPHADHNNVFYLERRRLGEETLDLL